ncbi:MAG: helix-turn-helix domain-containing protein [Gammaproteobacteria bacterium]|nr:helix-turn-helix domain-containing protein [Gammaproteobacteria bacterium]MBU1442770.1 helix-turn-helix domain-containing protein [Gammaproteobacteria bacterium]MBU2288815.1 helix-turn-helix domain-containing protein [Gammaproteobacteria bacterium]MBU2409921.1 helix-turn-helix domain-containing protein [Gammaproteobacteria bacterium]
MKQVLSVPSQLGPLLKAARKAAGLSQEKLAERVGISQSRMSHMELHPGSVSLEQLLALFAVLDLEVVVGSRVPEPRGSRPPTAREPAPPEW